MNFKLEKDNTILILLLYCDRPESIKYTLESIKNQPYKNWILAFCDDSVKEYGENIVRNIFDEDEIRKTRFYCTYDTQEAKDLRNEEYQKLNNPGHKIGTVIFKLFNKAIDENDHDICLFLCDDDALFENHLDKLNEYYISNPDVIYSYSNIILFDNRYEKYYESNVLKHRFSRTGKQHGYYNLDTSQVSWRSLVYKKDNLKFNEEPHHCFDAFWYDKLYQKYGLCEPNFLISQYKNFHREIYNL